MNTSTKIGFGILIALVLVKWAYVERKIWQDRKHYEQLQNNTNQSKPVEGLFIGPSKTN